MGSDPTGAPASGVNRFAIAALVLGLIGAFPLGAAAGLFALHQIRKHPQRGRGMALVGLAASAAWAVAAVVIIIVLAISGGGDDPATPGGDAAKATVELAPGDCLNGLREARSITSLPVVPCAEPHEGEVFATFTVPDGAWPGEQALAGQAETGCVQRLAEYSAKAAADTKLEIYFLHPTERTWARGDREVTCVAEDPAAPRTGSLRD